MREAAVLALVLALVLGRDILGALRGATPSRGGAPPPPLDVDRGMRCGWGWFGG